MPDLAALVRDADWLAHRYDPGHDAFHFRLTPRAGHDRATFLTDEYLGAAGEPVVIRREDALAVGLPSAPLHFLFHSAFCCSTLLARAFDLPGVAMGLKEPMIVNDLVGWKHRGGKGPEVARALDAGLTLLARPFAPGEAVVVKPSNIGNALIPAVLAMRPTSHALLLYAPLETFLGSVARKGMIGRLWVRDLLVKQLRDGLVDLGFGPEDYLGQTDLQAAAVGWLAQQALFARTVAVHGDRVRTLDSETLVARPAETMAALAELFGLALDAKAVAAGPAFRSHSKFGGVFDADARAAAVAKEAVHAEEIAKVAVWAEAVAANAGVPLQLPGRLLA